MNQRCSSYFENNASKKYVLISHTLKYMGSSMTRKTTLPYVVFITEPFFVCFGVFAR